MAHIVLPNLFDDGLDALGGHEALGALDESLDLKLTHR
jgi:hypothetical protein